jgi:hypothetical protein
MKRFFVSFMRGGRSEIMKQALAIVAVMVMQTAAHAGDPRCNAPPYGGSVAEFKAFVESFGQIVTPATILPSICMAKFGGESRNALYNLGFTDEQIDKMNLAVDFLDAVRKVARKDSR